MGSRPVHSQLSLRIWFVVCALVCVTTETRAAIPEPDIIYYGNATLDANFVAQFELEAKTFPEGRIPSPFLRGQQARLPELEWDA